MFKIKSKNEEFINTLMKYDSVVSNDDYKYVITDDSDMIENDKINIVFPNVDAINEDIILDAIIKETDIILTLKKDGEVFKIPTKEIDYFESIDNVVYAKINRQLYSCQAKLYSLEEMLMKKHFVRTSKYCLVNMYRIRSILPLLNSKLLLILKTGDRVEVNRTYVKEFKEKIKLK